MTEFSYNQEYLTKNGRPWFPIMGEIHYSRYPREYWKEEIQKMKAGGVDVISSYVIWIHHEEQEGEFDFGGQRNLRAFVNCCARANVYLFLRIGPWCHGEVRNGGFPDWLLQKPYEVRSNDPGYLAQVEQFYQQIFKQVKGLLWKDGGPIIGVQIENEYGHCGGLTGEPGEQHMRTLKEMAKSVGFDVPLYTATGWGGAVTGGMLPVMGGYCEAPWDQRITEIEPSGNYLFSYERNDHNIGSDYGLGYGLTFDPEKFPFLTAELGGGLQVTHHRRPVATGQDIGAMSLVKLGSGVNLLGYYMYHGGTNPKGKLSSLQESRETGYLNDLPELSYDFRAPLREYGQLSASYGEIKLLGTFVKDFGEALCQMPAYIPDTNSESADNYSDLRWSIRRKRESGYVFVNNYQRRHKMKAHNQVSLQVQLPEETLMYPLVDIKDKMYFFWPFNLDLAVSSISTVRLKFCCATPFCRLNQKSYVFYTDFDPAYCFENESERLMVDIVTLTRAEALMAYKIKLDQEYILINQGAVVAQDSPHSYKIYYRQTADFSVFPPLPYLPEGFEIVSQSGSDSLIQYREKTTTEQLKLTPTVRLQEETEEYCLYELQITGYLESAEDWFLQLFYEGDRAELFLDGQKIADDFYCGQPWEISLGRFACPETLMLKIFALSQEASVYLETWPLMGETGKACRLTTVTIEPEYSWNLHVD